MMQIFRMLQRGIRDAFKSVVRNFSLSIASIVCVSITLFIVSVAIILSANVNNFSTNIKKDVTIIAFLEKKSDKNAIQKELNELKNISKVEFVSKVDAKKELSDSSSQFKEWLKDWSDDDLPLKDSFKIKVSDLKQINDTVSKIEVIKGISSVNYGKTTIEKMLTTFEVVNKLMYTTVIILIVVTIFLIINTIKLTIYSRKREIEIMRVVGASNFAIKFPFVVEGMVLGFIGSIIPILLTIYLYSYVYNRFQGNIYSNIIKLMSPSSLVYTVSLILVIIGVIVGMLGSSGAVRKYLKL